MQSAFPIVVFGAVVFSIVMSLAFLFARGSLYDSIGQDGFAPAPDAPSEGLTGHLATPVSSAERELEVRQMLGARRERQIQRGESPLDVDAEVARLLADAPAPAHDAGLTAEVRQLVIARNERRARKGLEPLEVEAEVARTLTEMGG
jgi:hypothetical protein